MGCHYPIIILHSSYFVHLLSFIARKNYTCQHSIKASIPHTSIDSQIIMYEYDTMGNKYITITPNCLYMYLFHLINLFTIKGEVHFPDYYCEYCIVKCKNYHDNCEKNIRKAHMHTFML